MGLLAWARQVPSPNCDARPPGTVADLIIVHGISLPPGEFGGPYIDQLFTNSLPPAGHPYFEQIRELRVSSHLLIRRDGEVGPVRSVSAPRLARRHLRVAGTRSLQRFLDRHRTGRHRSLAIRVRPVCELARVTALLCNDLSRAEPRSHRWPQ